MDIDIHMQGTPIGVSISVTFKDSPGPVPASASARVSIRDRSIRARDISTSPKRIYSDSGGALEGIVNPRLRIADTKFYVGH